MQQIALKEAGMRLAELIGMAEDGEEVIITKDDGSGFKLIPFPDKRPCPKFGSAKGLVEMADDFDEPLEDFEEYMPRDFCLTRTHSSGSSAAVRI